MNLQHHQSSYLFSVTSSSAVLQRYLLALKLRPMARKSKLLAALDAHKGRDFMLEKQKKLQKQAEKRKRLKTVEKSPDADNSVESGVGGVDLNGAAAESGDENSGFESEESGGATPITVGHMNRH